MNKIRIKIQKLLSDFTDWSEHMIHRLYGKPTMMKQFIIVLVLGGFLSVFSLYSLVHSIYNIGKSDAQKEFLNIQHIKALELPQKSDSIQLIENGELKIKN